MILWLCFFPGSFKQHSAPISFNLIGNLCIQNVLVSNYTNLSLSDKRLNIYMSMSIYILAHFYLHIHPSIHSFTHLLLIWGSTDCRRHTNLSLLNPINTPGEVTHSVPRRGMPPFWLTAMHGLRLGADLHPICFTFS